MELRETPEYNVGKLEGFDEGYQKAAVEYSRLVKNLINAIAVMWKNMKDEKEGMSKDAKKG